MPDEPRVTVALPVGPLPSHTQWLEAALTSIHEQTVPVEILIIDDMQGLPVKLYHESGFGPQRVGGRHTDYRIPKLIPNGTLYWPAPWRLGVGAAFNVGVALAPTDLVFMMGADDTIEPDCIEQCLYTFDTLGVTASQLEQELTYYYVGVNYMDTGEKQFQPCNAAMVHKQLWYHTGGFPPETGSGAPDAALLSTLMGNAPRAGAMLLVSPSHPLYNYRRHPGTDTATRGPWQGVILETRNILTSLWEPPQWNALR